jgi:hypothetical protein
MVFNYLKLFLCRETIRGSMGITVIVAPAVVLLGGGSATAARTGGASRQIPESQLFTNP